METATLTSTDAFVVYDLDGAPSAGVVRSAPKILRDGAVALARTLTYRFASFERRVGGASAGINAAPDARAAAVAAFVAELEPVVADGRLVLDAARGVDAEALAPLHAVDGRAEAYRRNNAELTALGVAVAAETAAGGLDGRRVALEGFEVVGPALAAAFAERGAVVVALGTAQGTAAAPDGFSLDALVGGWSEHGPALVAQLGSEPAAPGAVFGAEADVLVAGSRPGVIDHEVAAGLAAGLVVPCGPTPVTAKALAGLRRAEVTVLADFVTTAGPLFAGWPDEAGADPAEAAAAAIAAVVKEVAGHEKGPLLGACERAEAFLTTWRDELPFGRPLA